MKCTRITVNPYYITEVPCIRVLPIPGNCGETLAESVTQDEILQAFPDLEQVDIREALQGGTDNHVV